ncbi:MAG: ABC transporter permease [Williamsia sp.]|nr:ABC transporter permease [Williamsia sp.]
MFAHLFTLIWNKKKQNLLLISEILVSFLVIFGVFSLITYDYLNYKKPMGFDYERVWVVNYSNPLETKSNDSVTLYYENLRQTLKAMPQVKEVSFTSGNFPFSNSTNATGLRHNGVVYSRINNFTVDDQYKEAINLKLLEGRWFNKLDAAAKDRPILINESLKEAVFGKEAAVGKYMNDWEEKNKLKIIGVVQDVKMKGDYTTIGNAVFNRIDSGAFHWLGNMLIKVTGDADAAFESRLYKVLAGSMKNANIEIGHLSNLRVSKNKAFLVPLIVISIVAGFLIINVALGLFGVLWYNINKRRGEIGLRRAIGASGKSVSLQLVTETMILSTLSLIIGAFFAIQFPILRVGDIDASVYLTALLLSILFIYLLVLVCSLYPGRQAAAIQPAVALHEE